jgi:hypothetical protein
VRGRGKGFTVRKGLLLVTNSEKGAWEVEVARCRVGGGLILGSISYKAGLFFNSLSLQRFSLYI